MGRPAETIPSFADLVRAIDALPEGVTGLILEPGIIHTMARPGAAHRFAQFRVRRALGACDGAAGGAGWWLEEEPSIRLPGDRLVVPDIAGWRLPTDETPSFVDENPILVVPQFACEVLSPTTERDDRRLKLPLYAEVGVEHVWLVDPRTRLVEVYETRESLPAQVASARDDDVSVLPPFGIELDVAAFWKPPASP